MRTGPGESLRASLCGAAEEELASAAFCTGDFTEADRLFALVLTMAEEHRDQKAEARALGGLAMVRHHRCITRLVAGLAPDDADVAAEEELMVRALAIERETGDPVGTARALFGMGLVHQVLHRDWAAAMPYYWQAYGLAEAVEESGDLYACSEIHRHLGFYYLIEDVRPAEAVRRLGYSLACASASATRGGSRAAWSRWARRSSPPGSLIAPSSCWAGRHGWPGSGLLPWRIEDAERSLREAEAVLASPRS